MPYRQFRRRSLRAAAVASVACVAPFLAPSGASAAWSQQTTPNAAVDHTALYDLACEPASTSVCVAVGKQTTGAADTPYAAGWNGSTWTAQSAAAPVGANASELQGADCASTTACVAVGHATTGANTVTLAETWNGTSWTIASTPNPAGATETRLRDVACNSATVCMAVGYQGSGSSTASVAVQRLSGSWSLVSVPTPAGAIATELDGIDCISTSSCVAVGRYTVSGGAYWAMAAAYNGATWSLQTIPVPSGATRSVLLDVSCSAATACTAVGGYTSSGVQKTFAARWDGTSWAHQPSPNPAGSSNSVFQDVSCQEATDCVAAGDWLNAGTWQPMAQSWNGSSWSLESAVNPSGATFGLLEGVACRIDCLAVGWYTDATSRNRTLGEVRLAPAWTQLSIHAPLANESLSDVACSSTSNCFSVGLGGGTGRIYSGPSGWALRDTPRPATAVSSHLRGVACVASPYLCVAVGPFVPSGGTETPYAASDTVGSGPWAVTTVPTPSNASAVLNDVSCSSSTACTAVGDYKSASIARMYAARWNGSAWSVQTVPAIAGSATDQLRSVSCPAANTCVAAGHGSVSGQAAIVAVWNGTSWAAQVAPLPAGGTAGRLEGVSCASATSCVAVGWASDRAVSIHWNGSTWTPAWGPLPEFASDSYFEGVSCTSSTACVAVGRYVLPSGTTNTLAADWDGTSWTLHRTPNPGLPSRVFLGVDCPAAGTCRAVGWTNTGGTTDLAAALP
jgi:hypothetical protein